MNAVREQEAFSTRNQTQKRDSRGLYLWLFVFFTACNLLVASGRIDGGDAGTMYLVTRNMLEYGSIALRAEVVLVPAQSYPGFLPTREYAVETATLTYNGRLGYDYSRYGWGQSLVGAPLYLVGRALSSISSALGPQFLERLWIQLLNALVLSATAVVLAASAHSLGLSPWGSVGLACIFSFGTYAWPYVKTFYSEPATTLFLLLAAFALHRYESTGRANSVFWAGLWFGLSLVFRSTAFLGAPALGIYFLWAMVSQRHREQLKGPGFRLDFRAIILGGAGCLPGVILMALYSWLRFGWPLSAGYTRIAWDNPLLNGLYGLLFSPGKGLFIYCPILLLSLGGIILLWQSRRGIALMVSILFATYVLFHAPYSFWTGGWNWGPRFLLPVVPFLLLPAGVFLQEAKSRIATLVFVLLIALSVVIQLPAVLVNHSRDMIALSEQDDRFYDKTIFETSLSPVLRQWPVAVDVLGQFNRDETRAAAREVLAEERAKWIRPGAPDTDVMAGLTKESEFIHNNVPDFWWIYLYLLGASPFAIFVPVTALVLAAGAAVVRITGQLKSIGPTDEHG